MSPASEVCAALPELVRGAAVIGGGRSGRGAAGALARRGVEVTIWDRAALSADGLPEGVLARAVEDADVLASEVIGSGVGVVVVSPGIPPHHPIFAACTEAGLPLWGEVELAWRLQEAGGHAGRPWLCVTGTNGKTTTVGMVTAILRAAGEDVAEVGNVGTPITRAIDSDAAVFSVELSSFQLYTAPSLSPEASVCLNVDADHLDWHGDVAHYSAAKAKVYEHTRLACVYPAWDADVEAMVENADVVEGARAIGLTLGVPGVSQVGLVEGAVVDRAFLATRHREALHVADLSDLEPAYGPAPSPAVVADALAAVALTRAHGVAPEAIAEGLRAFRPAAHRRAVVGRVADLTWVDDSKATNAHAAEASLKGVPAGTAVWIAGGDTKGQEFDDLVRRVAPQLRGVVIIGEDRSAMRGAFERQAPQVPRVEVDGHEDWMYSVVNEAVALSRPGDTVFLAPAAASWDQFDDYGQRGDVFVEAVQRLARAWGSH